MDFVEVQVVPKLKNPTTVFNIATKLFKSIPTRNNLKKVLKGKRLFLNGKLAYWDDALEGGERLELLADEIKPSKPFDLEFEILFEDDFLAIVNKPAGIPVSGNQFKTMRNAVVGKFKKSTETDALAWAKPVHRIDLQTSGLLLFAKTNSASSALGDLFQNKKIEKTYLAIVCGKVENKQTIDLEIDNQPSETLIIPKQSVRSLKNNFITLLACKPITGRTHQIRKHVAGISHPIMGDTLYGETGKVLSGKGLFLCATGMAFSHPINNKQIDINISPPSKFASLMEREQRRWEKMNNEHGTYK